MNPRSEFVKAIIQVLRLEANIYTMGAVEEIIERIKQDDYAMFIAYLGEREGNYEKPIQTIAKGVDEFYEMKVAPIKAINVDKAKKLFSQLSGIVSYDSEIIKQNMLKEEQRTNPFANVFQVEREAEDIICKEIGDKGYEHIKKFKFGNNGEDTISKDDFNKIDNGFGFKNLMYDFSSGNTYIRILNSLMGDIAKPSIIEKIQNNAVSNASGEFNIESNKVKALLNKPKHSIYN